MAEKWKAAYQWLQEKGIALEEAFIPALRRYAVQYQHVHGFTYLDDVYRLIGTHKAHVSYWEKKSAQHTI